MPWAMEGTAEMVVWVYTWEALTALDIVAWVALGVQAEMVVATAPPTVLVCYRRSQYRDKLGMVPVRFAHHDPLFSYLVMGNCRSLKSYVARNQDRFYGIRVCTPTPTHLPHLTSNVVPMIRNLLCYSGAALRENFNGWLSRNMSIVKRCLSRRCTAPQPDVISSMEPGLTASTLPPQAPTQFRDLVVGFHISKRVLISCPKNRNSGERYIEATGGTPQWQCSIAVETGNVDG